MNRHACKCPPEPESRLLRRRHLLRQPPATPRAHALALVPPPKRTDATVAYSSHVYRGLG